MASNIKTMEFYVEKYEKIKIPIRPTVNQSNVLYVDDHSNSLYSLIHVGQNVITSLVGYGSNYYNSLLVYNDKEFALLKDFITEDRYAFSIAPNLPTKYKINAKRDTITNQSDSRTFTLDLVGRTVFKVFYENRELQSNQYTASTTGVTISDSIIMDLYENALTVISYVTDQTITSGFYLTYDGVKNRYDIEDSCTQTFFSNMLEISEFAEFGDTITKSITNYTKGSSNIHKNAILTDFVGSISLSNYAGINDLANYVGGDLFRVLAYDPYEDVLIIYVMCKVNTGTNLAIGNMNTKTVQIDFVDRITIYGSNSIAYGTGLYGVGTYGSNLVYSELYKKGL